MDNMVEWGKGVERIEEEVEEKLNEERIIVI